MFTFFEVIGHDTLTQACIYVHLHGELALV